jgi:hypothetical protein
MLTVQRMRRLEVWSDLACTGGTRQAVIGDAATCVASVTLAGDDQLTITLSINSLAVGWLAEGKVLRVDESDTSFDEWRIVGVTTDTGTQMVQVTATPVAHDLADRGIITQTLPDGTVLHDIAAVGLTPTVVIDTFILPTLVAAGVTWVARGTVTPTSPVDVSYAWDTPLAALKRLAEDTGTEFQLQRNGTAGYLIDLIASIGGDAPVADLRAARNLPGLAYDRTVVGQPTRIYPRGASEDGIAASMAIAPWKVTDVAGSVVSLADPLGGDGPIAFDGQLVGCKLRKVDGTTTNVTASSASGQNVTVASATGIAVDDIVMFRDPSGNDLTYLEHPTLVTEPGGLRVGVLDQQDIPDTVNLLVDPGMRDWPFGATPGQWAAVGSVTATKDTVLTEIGGALCHLVATADGGGIETALAPIVPVPTADHPYLSGYAHVYVSSGQVRVELVTWSAAKGFKTYPIAPDVATSSAQGSWLDLGVAGIDAHADGATHAKLRIVQHGSTAATFNVDAGQITATASQRPFLEGACGTKLWQAANAQLKKAATAIVTFTASIVDLARLDPTTWGPDCSLVLGGTVRLIDARAGVSVLTRLTGIQRDYLVPGRSSVTLSNDPKDITQLALLSGAPARPRFPTLPIQPSLLSGAARGLTGLDAAGRLETGVNTGADIAGVNALAASRGRSAFLEPWDALPEEWLSFRTGTFALVAAAGVTGGNVLRCTGNVLLTFPHPLPFDPSKLYRVRGRARQVTDPTSGGKQIFIGIACYDASGASLGNSWVAAKANTLIAGAGWTTYTGWVKGTTLAQLAPAPDPTTPSGLPAGTVAIAPAFALNENGGNGVADIDYLAVDVLDEDASLRTYIGLDPTGRLDSGVNSGADVGGTQVTTLLRDKGRALVHEADNAGGGNCFAYRQISTAAYTIQAGDVLEYDVYLDPNNPAFVYALELHATDNSVMRSSAIVDADGQGQFRNLAALAKGKWYHRTFDLTPWVGKTIDSWQSAHESDPAGHYSARLAHIAITNAGTVQIAPLASGPLQQFTSAPGAGVTRYTNQQLYIIDDAALRSTTGLDDAGRLTTGVNETADVAGRDAAAVKRASDAAAGVRPDALALFTFEDGSGTTVRNHIGTGDADVQIAGAGWITGPAGGAYDADHAAQIFATASPTTAFNVGSGADFTIDAIVRWDGNYAGNTDQYIVVHENDYEIGITATGYLWVAFRDAWIANQTGLNLNDIGLVGTWMHLHVQCIGASRTVSTFINGALLSTFVAGSNPTAGALDSVLRIGCRGAGAATQRFNGSLAYLRIVRALADDMPFLDAVIGPRAGTAIDADGQVNTSGFAGAALLQAASLAQQLQPNGDFEAGYSYFHPTGAGALELDGADHFSGLLSAKLVVHDSFNNDIYGCIKGSNLTRLWDGANDLYVRVDPGTILRVSGAAKCDVAGLSGTMGFRYFDANRQHLGWQFILSWSETDWTYKEESWVVPADCYYVVPWFTAQQHATLHGNFIRFDQLRWERVDKRAWTALDGDGNLTEGVGQVDGGVTRVLARGHLAGTARHTDTVLFPVNFSSPPMIILTGGVTDEPRAKWGPTGSGSETGSKNASLPVYEDMIPLNLGVSSFQLRARKRQKGTLTNRTNTFPSGAIAAEGATLAVTLANAPAADDRYTVTYDVSLSVVANGFTGFCSISCTVAVDTLPSGGSWTERDSRTYSTSGDGGAGDDWLGQQVVVSVSGLTSAAQIRVRIKQVTINGKVGSVSVDPGDVKYVTSSGDIFASKTPDASDFIAWEAMAVS